MNGLISALNDFSAGWLPAVARASIQGGIFVAAVWVLCRVFRGLPGSLRYWIWWIACAQWIVRLVLVSPIELPVLPAETATVAPSIEASAPVSFLAQPFETVSAPSANYAVPVVVNPVTIPTPTLTLASMAMLLWALGMLSLGMFSVRKLAQTRRIVLGARPISEDAGCAEIAAELSQEMGIRMPILRESEAIRCPMLAGWFRPTILLPADFAQSESKQIVRLALAHEMAHIRRHDLWFGAAPALGQLVLFFHPLAWLAVHEAAAAREESCDIEALHVAGGTPATYARLLLDTAQANSLGAALGAAFGYRLLHRRIKMLNQSLRLDSRRTRRAASLLVLASALCSLPWTVTGQTTKPAKLAQKSTASATKKSSKPQKATTKSTKASKAVTVKGTAVKATAAVLPYGETVVVATGAPVVAGKAIASTNVVRGQAFSGVATVNGTAGSAFSGTMVTGQAFNGVATATKNSSNAVAGQRFGGVATGTGASRNAVSGTVVSGQAFGGGVAGTGVSSNAVSGGAIAGQGFGGTAFSGQAVSGTSTNRAFRGTAVKATNAGGRGFGTSVSGVARSANADGQATSKPAENTGGGFGGAAVASDAVATGGFGGGGFGGGSSQGDFQHMEAIRGEGSPDEHSVTVRFKNIDVRSAITAMFHAADVNFVIRSGVGASDDLVTCELTNRPIAQALEALLKGAKQELTYRVEGNVYYITVKSGA